MPRPVAIFRFSPSEGPGRFGEYLSRSRIGTEEIALDEGAAVPADPERFAGIGLMGGPMSVNDPLPWIPSLAALLRDAVAARVPVLGHCLGGQLLAHALGAPVTRAPIPEIGWWPVRVVDPRDVGWFGGRSAFTAFQWHFDTFALPPAGRPLLGGEHCPNQGFVVDGRHLGFQCHIEMTRPMVETWCRHGADEITATGGPAVQPVAEITRALERRLADLGAVADAVYARWVEGLPRVHR